MKNLKQITNPTDFMVGKTIIKTGKGTNPSSDMKVISFIFDDDSFVLFGLAKDNIIMIPNTDNHLDKKSPHSKLQHAVYLRDLGLEDDEYVEACRKEFDNYFIESDKDQFRQILKRHPEFKELVK